MPATKISSVKINGRNKLGTDAYIYNVNFNKGLGDGPSSIVVTFLSETGQYTEIEMGPQKLYKIDIGNSFSGNFYALERTIERSSNGRTLNVTFIDGSNILDRIWVGLYKRMGSEDTNIPGLLIVGQEMSPCDIDEDGAVTQADFDQLKANGRDPCELKCPNDYDFTEPVLQDCIQREDTQIFDVKYTFNQLLDAMEGKGGVSIDTRPVLLPVINDQGQQSNLTFNLPAVVTNKAFNSFNKVKLNNRPKEINREYFKDYTGPLRDVLNNWCAEFGYTFLWENDGLTFVDTKERPNINLEAFSNLESTKDVKSYEGTVARGVISHYAEPGILAEIDCPIAKSIYLRCLTLQDLYGAFYLPTWRAQALNQADLDYAVSTESTVLDPPIADPENFSADNQQEYRDDVNPAGVPIESFEKSCVCAFYGPTFRNAYNFFSYYGITGPDQAVALKDKWLDRLGQAKILNVFAENSADTDAQRKYGHLIKGGYEGEAKKLFSEDVANIFKSYNAYFMLVERPFRSDEQEEDLLEKQFRMEEKLANDFIGKHWYRAFAAQFFGPDPQFSPSAQYLSALSVNIEDLPFAQFYHTYRSTISKMVSSFVNKQKNDFRAYGGLKFSGNFATNIAKKIVRSIVYFQKNAPWSPTQQGYTEVKGLIESLERLKFQKIPLKGLSENALRSIKTVGGVTKGAKNIELWVCFPLSTPFAVRSEFIDNPYEEKLSHDQGIGPYELATYGLTSPKCVRYTINNLQIYTPAAGSVLFSDEQTFRWQFRQPNVTELSTPKYKVYVTATTSNRGIIPKFESTLIKSADPKKAFAVDYLVNEIDKSSLRFLNKLTSDCRLSPTEIKKLHEVYVKSMNFNSDKPFRSISYRIYGTDVGKTLKISEGLESFSVQIDADGAVITDFTMSDKVFTPLPIDYLLKKFETEARKNHYHYRQNPI